MTEARVKKTINAPTEKVWKTIRDFDGIDRYLGAVKSCTVEGSGEGAKRTCVLQDGVKINERLESLDEEKRTLSYSIIDTDPPMPFTGYVGTVKVSDTGGDRTEVDWSGTFEVKGADEAEMVAMTEGLYGAAIDGLEKLCGKGAEKEKGSSTGSSCGSSC